MTNITVDIIKRHGGYCIDTCIDGQPVSSLGPLDTEEQAIAVRQHQAAAVRWTLEQSAQQIERFMREQRRAVA